MKFLDDGVEESWMNYKIEMKNDEKGVLLEYSRKNMTEDEYEEIMINWAIIKILEKRIEEENELKKEDK